MKSDEEIMEEWLEADRDGRLTMDHPLNENSIVLDIGSYTGGWSFKIYDKYKCSIYSYEPVQEFHKQHKQNVGDRKIYTFNYALDVEDGKKDIFLNKDGTSFFLDKKSESVSINTANASEVFSSFDRIDLAKINIEGSEYDVLNLLYESGQINKPNRLMIQFHKIPGYEGKISDVREKLSQSHSKLWGYGTIWELWERM